MFAAYVFASALLVKLIGQPKQIYDNHEVFKAAQKKFDLYINFNHLNQSYWRLVINANSYLALALYSLFALHEWVVYVPAFLGTVLELLILAQCYFYDRVIGNYHVMRIDVETQKMVRERSRSNTFYKGLM